MKHVHQNTQSAVSTVLNNQHVILFCFMGEGGGKVQYSTSFCSGVENVTGGEIGVELGSDGIEIVEVDSTSA